MISHLVPAQTVTSAHIINLNPNSSHTPRNQYFRAATLARQYITNSTPLVAMFNQALLCQDK